MTAEATVESRAECMASGMDEFVTKPVAIEELIDVLTRRALTRWTVPSDPIEC
jgi:CheY-like chemotaxis protein